MGNEIKTASLARSGHHGLDIIIVATLFFGALAIRSLKLFSLDVWFDEVAILLQIQMSYAEIWNFCKLENFPPLYSWLVKLLSSGVQDPVQLRWFSAVIGALVPPIAYLLGREIQDRKLGLLLGFATILSLPLLYFSQVIRMYSLFAFAFTLSYLGFLKGLRTNEWKYWFLMAAANLIAFYSFLFAVFFIFSEFLILIWQYRLSYKKYFRPVIAHLPSFFLIAFWFLTFLHRYQVVQSYVYSKMLINDPLDLLIYFGTGILFNHSYLIGILFNLPFILGFYLSIKKWTKGSPQFFLGMIFTSSLGLIMFLSIVKQSIFFSRYLLFLLPIYLVLSLFGWLHHEKKLWRSAGVVLIFVSLIASYTYYLRYFIEVNDEYRHHGLYHSAPDEDGHSLSNTAALIQQRISPDEAIIHFSKIVIRTLSFFPSVFYHQRALPEYIYSVEDLPIHCGQQYLKPGERISQLSDIHPLPSGIWVVTWEKPELVIFDSPWFLDQRREGKLWFKRENIPEQLYLAGYRAQETIRYGGISTVHFIRIANIQDASGSEAGMAPAVSQDRGSK